MYPSILLDIYLPSLLIYVSIYLSDLNCLVYLCTYLSIYLSIYLYLCIYLSIYLSIYPSVPPQLLTLCNTLDAESCGFHTLCTLLSTRSSLPTWICVTTQPLIQAQQLLHLAAVSAGSWITPKAANAHRHLLGCAAPACHRPKPRI